MDLITLALLGLGLNLAKGAKTANRLEYFPLNIEVIRGKLYFVMEILNPTKNPLKVDSFFGGVFVDDKKVGSIEKGEQFEVKANGRTKVKFPVRLNALGAGTVLAQIIAGKFNKKFKVAGIARALGLDNEVSKEITLGDVA